jgi:hypothetical protein
MKREQPGGNDTSPWKSQPRDQESQRWDGQGACDKAWQAYGRLAELQAFRANDRSINPQ